MWSLIRFFVSSVPFSNWRHQLGTSSFNFFKVWLDSIKNFNFHTATLTKNYKKFKCPIFSISKMTLFTIELVPLMPQCLNFWQNWKIQFQMIETVSKLISINNLSDLESALTSHFKSRGKSRQFDKKRIKLWNSDRYL